ncbi:MAG TPA: YerC/YecD family TrpR-related protein [Gammaproteobacteria bacterium]|nr:YerC/YecD family TrpR-related protein [Gammaproteobacteria bacterium]
MSDEHIIDLYEALLLLGSKQEARDFLKDLCTPQEIVALTERWRVCQLLDAGELSYREIHAVTGASITTVGRVARFLKDEPYHGYRAILDKIKLKKKSKV